MLIKSKRWGLLGCGLALATLLANSQPAQAAKTIFISPGQCIVLGSQQICALNQNNLQPPGSVQPVPAEPPRVLHLCRYGHYQESEVPDLKSYQLIEVTVAATGITREINIKNFGPNGKDACEKELKEKEKENIRK